MFSSPRIISKLGTLLQESRLRPSQEQKEIPDSAPRSCSLLHTAQSSFLPLGALEGMAHWQCKGMSLSLGSHLSDPNVTYTDSTSSSGHFLCRLWKAQLVILGTLSYTGRKCQPSKQDLGDEFPEMPKISCPFFFRGISLLIRQSAPSTAQCFVYPVWDTHLSWALEDRRDVNIVWRTEAWKSGAAKT